MIVEANDFDDDDDDNNNKQKLPDAFVGNGASVIRPLLRSNQEKDANKYFTYITMDGQKNMDFTSGGWTIKFPPGGGGKSKIG